MTQSIEESGTLQGYDAMKEAMAMKIIEQTSSSRNISTDTHATDGGVTAPAVAKTGKGICARVFDAIAESQMKRTERELDRCRLLRTMHFRENGGNHG